MDNTMNQQRGAWPFLYSGTPRGIVRNGLPAATTPGRKQRGLFAGAAA